jgi:pimeloyl-ACP methyl ester carboxylesterase/predicted Ser/Thr protein kinase
MPVSIGDKLGPYEIIATIGAGGMGEVFKARDTRLDRFVAIKFLFADLADSAARRRFQREAQMASSLNHPHIVTVHDVGEYIGRQYLVTEYIDGGTLKEWTRTDKRTCREIVELLVGVADGLATAHAADIVHRDIKPDNILITRSGYAKLADFGLAKLAENSAPDQATSTLTEGRTRPGVVIGTLAYMSPEQASGNPLGARSDIFSFGVVLYEMVSGRKPFAGASNLEVLQTIIHGSPQPLSDDIPAALRTVVEKALEKDPADRYQSMREMVVDLRRLTRQRAQAQPQVASAPSHWRGAQEELRNAERAEIVNQLVERRFTLGERVCRKLNRATLDPRIIGDHLHYVDNQIRSDVLVFFLHGLGLDHGDFGPILKRLPYRGVSPTLYGCEPNRRPRVAMSLADHVVILREWLRDVAGRCQATTVVMVGFSLGADMGFDLLLESADEPAPPIDAFLSLECNISLDTCFVSRVFAGIAPDRPEVLIAELRQLVDTATSLDEWLNIHEYLVKVLRKYQGDIAVLQRAGADIVRRFSETQGFEVFARRFKNARERVPALRMVFSNAAGSQAALTRLKLENLDSGILGSEFPEDMITVSPNADHFDLMDAERVLRQVDELVAETRTRRRPSTGKTGAEPSASRTSDR